MSFDFFAAMRLPENEECIDDVVHKRNQWSMLYAAPWTTRAQVLATGLVYGALADAIKNGRKPGRNVTGIAGHPQLVRDGCDVIPMHWLDILVPDSRTVSPLPHGSCLLQFTLRLQRPFYSRDDLAFYPVSNPLKRDHVFQWPYLGAAGVKGLLRWAWRMCNEDNEENKHIEYLLFGPRPGDCDEEHARQGCLFTWPVFWEGKSAEDIINPQSREKCSGKDPVRYEVMPAGSQGCLSLLLFNRDCSRKFPCLVLEPFLEVLEYLLSSSGLSAKRTSDWGSVDVTGHKAWMAGIQGDMAPASAGRQEEEQRLWDMVCGNDGELLAKEDLYHTEITKRQLSFLTARSIKQCAKQHRDKVYQALEKKFEEYQQEAGQAGINGPGMETAAKTIKEFTDPDFASWRGQLLEAVKPWGRE